MKALLNDIPVSFLDSGNFLLIAGPCVIESREICFQVAEELVRISNIYQIPFVFKSSFIKANRNRADSFRGLDTGKALAILEDVRKTFGVPILTDIHQVSDIELVKHTVDILQIPAFLSRQTELLEEAGRSGKIVNIKKGQFLAPEAMAFAAEKISATGNNRIILTERGTTFGYTDLVVDMRAIPIMKSLGYPVILDVTHSLQKPNQSSGISGGTPSLIRTLAFAGIAAGADGIFMETHPDPSKALSDGNNMLKLSKTEKLISDLTVLYKTIKNLE